MIVLLKNKQKTRNTGTPFLIFYPVMSKALYLKT